MEQFTKEQIEYQTWLVKVNLDNTKENYDHIKELGESLIACDDYDFKVIIKNEFSYHDTIVWGAVDFAQVRQSVAECI